MSEQARLEYLPLHDLRAAPRNPKSHDKDGLHASFLRFGFKSPVLINEATGLMVAGHGRYETLVEMKNRGEIPPEGVLVRHADNAWLVPVVRGLTFKDDKEAEAYLLADNQLTIALGFDQKQLELILPEHQMNVNGLGFSKEDLEKYIPQFRTVELEPKQPEQQETNPLSLKCPKCGYEFAEDELGKRNG
jgi:hypothetical protein